MADDRWSDNPFLRVKPDGTVLFPSSWTEEARKNWLDEHRQPAQESTDGNIPVVYLSADTSGTEGDDDDGSDGDDGDDDGDDDDDDE